MKSRLKPIEKKPRSRKWSATFSACASLLLATGLLLPPGSAYGSPVLTMKGNCGNQVSASKGVTCAFARNIYKAWSRLPRLRDAGYQKVPHVYDPAKGRYRTVTCFNNDTMGGPAVFCDLGADRAVTFGWIPTAR